MAREHRPYWRLVGEGANRRIELMGTQKSPKLIREAIPCPEGMEAAEIAEAVRKAQREHFAKHVERAQKHADKLGLVAWSGAENEHLSSDS